MHVALISTLSLIITAAATTIVPMAALVTSATANLACWQWEADKSVSYNRPTHYYRHVCALVLAHSVFIALHTSLY